MSLAGKNAIITGATGGLGREITKKLLDNGCNVFLFSKSFNKLESFAKEMRQKYKNLLIDGCSGDYSSFDSEGIKYLCDKLPKKIDILINNAGVFEIKNILDVSLEDYDQFMNINVKFPFILSQYAAKEMIKTGGGKIVNIGSSSSYNGSGETGIYSITKHALLGMSRSFFTELKKYGIKVYCVSPGSLKTEMSLVDKRQDYNTFLEPEEVAEYVAFILKSDSNLIAEEIRLNRMIVK